MARFTIDDCMSEIKNRYELTLLGATRARQIANGSNTLLADDENDKPTVLALRELAANLVGAELLEHVSN